MTAASDDGVEERRALQRKAFGPGGGLTEAEAARLRELDEARRRPPSAELSHDSTEPSAPVAAPAVDDDSSHAAAPAGEETGDDGAVPEPGTGSEDTEPSAEPSATAPVRRRRLGVLALAAVVVLLLGIGVGWLAFGRGGEAVALGPEQQQWQADLIASGRYDSGSVRPIAVEDDAVIWMATQNGGKSICLVLGSGTSVTPSCNGREAVQAEGLWGSITTKRDAEDSREVMAQLLLTADGQPAVAVSVSEYGPDGLGGITYSTEAETATAERLAAEGFAANSIWIAGYDGDVPVWTASDSETGRQCLIYDGSTPDAPMVCETTETLQEHDGRLRLQVTDTESGGVTTYELPTAGPGSFVIIREGMGVGAGGD